MRKLIFILSLLVAGGSLYTESTTGQDIQDSEGSLLPDIDPQDIEIRTQYRARFPGLRRQPILGFSPGSRVYQIDPDRSPFLEEYEEIAAQLPVSELGRPEAPEYRPFPFATPKNGYGRLGLGNYISTEADMYLNREVSEGQWFTGSLVHSSGGDYLDQNSSFRYLDLESSYRGKLSERSVLGVSAGVNSDANHLAQPDGDNFEFIENPGRKSYSSFHGAARLKRFENHIEHLDIGLNTRFSSIDLNEEHFNFSSDLVEWNVDADASYTWTGERIHETYSLNTDFQTGGYQITGREDLFWRMAGLSGTYERLFNYRTKIDATIGVYHVGDATDNSLLRIAPDILVEQYLSDRITFSANLKGKPEFKEHFSHHLENRFLIPDNVLRHTYTLKTTAQLSVEPLPNNVIRVGVSFQTSDNYPFYRRQQLEAGGEPVSGHYIVDYDDVIIPRAFAGVNVDLIRERVWFDVEGYYQNPSMSEGRKVPFMENSGLSGAMTIRPVDRISLEAWGEVVGSRETRTQRDLDPYFNIGSKLELRLTERVGVYGKLINLLDQDYEIWEGFNERPFQVYGGVTLIF